MIQWLIQGQDDPISGATFVTESFINNNGDSETSSYYTSSNAQGYTSPTFSTSFPPQVVYSTVETTYSGLAQTTESSLTLVGDYTTGTSLSSGTSTTVISAYLKETTTQVQVATETTIKQTITETIGYGSAGKLSDTVFMAIGNEVLWKAAYSSVPGGVIVASEAASFADRQTLSAWRKTQDLVLINSSQTETVSIEEITQSLSFRYLTAATIEDLTYIDENFQRIPMVTTTSQAFVYTTSSSSYTVQNFAQIVETGGPNATRIQTGLTLIATPRYFEGLAYEEFAIELTTRSVVAPTPNYVISYTTNNITVLQQGNTYLTEPFFGQLVITNQAARAREHEGAVVDQEGAARAYYEVDRTEQLHGDLYAYASYGILTVKPGTAIISTTSMESGNLVPIGTIQKSYLSASVTTTRSANNDQDTDTSSSFSFEFQGAAAPYTKGGTIRSSAASAGILGEYETMFATTAPGAYRNASNETLLFSNEQTASYTGTTGDGAGVLFPLSYLDGGRFVGLNAEGFVWTTLRNPITSFTRQIL
jgi:hypothetical protein